MDQAETARVFVNLIWRHLMGLSLTAAERLTLINQYEMLAILSPDRLDEYKVKIEVLSCGFELEYPRLGLRYSDPYSDDITPDSLDAQECEFVIKLLIFFLELWKAIDDANENLSTTEQFRSSFPQFTGPYRAYVEFLFAGKSDIWEFNDCSIFEKRSLQEYSNALIPQYKAMLKRRWEIQVRKDFVFDLTFDDIREILDWKKIERGDGE